MADVIVDSLLLDGLLGQLLQSSLLDQIQGLIRCINSDVALLLAESGEIKRSVRGPHRER